MSETSLIHVAANPRSNTNKVSTTSTNEELSDEKQKEFGGVLSKQVKTQDTDKTQELSDNQSVSDKKTSEETEELLPQDGNDLPGNEQNVVNIAESVAKETEVAILAGPLSHVVTGIKVKLQSQKTPTTAATLALTKKDDSVLTDSVNHLRRLESIKAIALASRSQLSNTSLQTNKMVEQLVEANVRPVTAVNNIATLGSIISSVAANNVVSGGTIALQQVSIDLPVQHQQWQRLFAERVVWSVGNNQSVQVRLNPAELGQIDIHIKLNKEQASITFNTSNAMTRDSIELALPRLREMLASEGVELADVEVSYNEGSAQERTSEENNNRQAGLSHQESMAEESSDIVLHSVMLSEHVVDYYV